MKTKISYKRKLPLLLVTNDDGVRAPGIAALEKSLKGIGRVVVVAPDGPQSASSHSVTLHRPLRINHLTPNCYSVDGTPADCVMLGINKILDRRPDIVVSGINHGANVGEDVHYSGTVSAAFEGCILGIPSIAISLCTHDEHCDFSAAASFAARISRALLREGLPRGVMLNVNVPAEARKGNRFLLTRQGKRDYGSVIEEKIDPRGRKYYWIGGKEVAYLKEPGSDCNAILEGMISVTPLNVDLTDGAVLASLTAWRI